MRMPACRFPRERTGLHSGLRAGLAAWLMAGTAVFAGRPSAPDYAARPLGEIGEVALVSLKGQVVLLNTWATWCPPCREEMPGFETLYQRYRDQGLQVVGVNIDEGQADEKVQRYVEGSGISFPIWRDPLNRFAKRFRVLGVPETFLISREGVIVHHWRGPMDPNAPENLVAIEQALKLTAMGAATASTALEGAAPAVEAEVTPARGRRLAEQRGCLNCHSTDGAHGVGPSWKGLAGSQAKLADGRSVTRDRDYLTRAILEPDAEIVAGYSPGVMGGAMPGRRLNEVEVAGLVRYLESL